VVDFIDVDFFNLEFIGIHASRFPVFNFADASVSCGVVLLLLFHRRFTEPDRNPASLAPIAAGETPAPSASSGLANNFDRSRESRS
jgi:hypothetical protein